jgi:hypothetical protein
MLYYSNILKLCASVGCTLQFRVLAFLLMEAVKDYDKSVVFQWHNFRIKFLEDRSDVSD